MPNSAERSVEQWSEPLLATLSQLLVAANELGAAEILASGRTSIDWVEHDNWDGGVDIYRLTIYVAPSEFVKRTRNDWSAVAEIILEHAREIDTGSTNLLRLVDVRPSVAPKPDWRESVLQAVRGTSINNQGRVRSDNVASIECDGLHFRSQAEVHVYRALKSAGVVFAPLPVFVQGGRSYRRLEPDFVIVSSGRSFVIEVDGDGFHNERPSQADRRTEPLENQGVFVRHISSAECDSEEKARTTVARLLESFRAMRH